MCITMYIPCWQYKVKTPGSSEGCLAPLFVQIGPLAFLSAWYFPLCRTLGSTGKNASSSSPHTSLRVESVWLSLVKGALALLHSSLRRGDNSFLGKEPKDLIRLKMTGISSCKLFISSAFFVISDVLIAIIRSEILGEGCISAQTGEAEESECKNSDHSFMHLHFPCMDDTSGYVVAVVTTGISVGTFCCNINIISDRSSGDKPFVVNSERSLRVCVWGMSTLSWNLVLKKNRVHISLSYKLCMAQ